MKEKLVKNKKWFIILTIVMTLLTIDNIALLVNIAGLYSIENTLRLIVCIILVLITILSIFLELRMLIKNKKKGLIILLILSLIYVIGIGIININFNMIYGKIDKVSTNYTTYSISLVTTSSNEVNSIDKIGNDDIGIINDHNIANGYTFGEQILKEKKLSNTLKEYESYINIINDLLDGTIKYAFLPSNYIESFSTIEGYENIGSKLKTIYEQSKQEEQASNQKGVDEPFTMLLMGVDSTQDEIANTTANGDSLLLVTFNPKTLSATMVSIPRDSYVPIVCMSNKKNKITHSSWGGEKCIIDTIQNFTGINIDYYAKINFSGLVKLVDTLGGIDVNVEYSFCEQNSKRQWDENTVYVKEGQQTINGEQALAYARNRHPNPSLCSQEWTNYNSNDFIRGQHQQDIIKAIMTKLKDIKDIDTFYGILDTISKNMETNMEKNTILSFYNVAKDVIAKSKNASSIDDLLKIQKLYLSGYDSMIYDYSQNTGTGMRMVLYDFVPYKGSLNDIVDAMKINLGEKDKTIVKKMSFDINEPFKEEVIGKKSYSESTIALLPNFVGKTKSYVESYARAHSLKVTTITQSSSKAKDTVISQDPPAQMDLDNISSSKGITIYVSGNSSTSSSSSEMDYSLCTEQETKDSKCTIDFPNIKISRISTLNSKLNGIITLSIGKAEDNTEKSKEGNISAIKVNGKTISLKAWTIYDLLKEGKSFEVDYYGDVKDDTSDVQKPNPSTAPVTTPEP